MDTGGLVFPQSGCQFRHTVAQPRLKGSFIYLANAVNDLRGNWAILAAVLAPVTLLAALCLLPDAINLQYEFASRFGPGVHSITALSGAALHRTATATLDRPPFSPWVTAALHLLLAAVTLFTDLVTMCTLKRLRSGEREGSTFTEVFEVYRVSAGLLGPFFWIVLLRLLAIAVGAVLLVIPALLAFFWLYFSGYALVFDGRHSWSALLFSRELLRRRFFRVAVRIVVFLAVLSGYNSWAGGVFFVVSLLLGPVAALTGTIATTILMLDLLTVAVYYATNAFFIAAGVRLYEDLRELASGQVLEAAEAELSPEAGVASPTAALSA